MEISTFECSGSQITQEFRLIVIFPGPLRTYTDIQSYHCLFIIFVP